MSEQALTLEVLEAALHEVAMPDWARRIRDADDVFVKTSPYLATTGTAYLLDPQAMDLFGMVPLSIGRVVYVICHSEDEGAVRRIVDDLRTPDSEASDG